MIIGSITEYSVISAYWIAKEEQAAPAEETAPQVAEQDAIDEEENQKKNADKLRGENGVLRLLEEGHFKPHADMRLREIFHRELDILEEQKQPEGDATTEELPQDDIQTDLE